MDDQRRSFTVNLKEDNVLDGLLLLKKSGKAADNPLMQSLNMTAIEDITADGAMDADELRYLVRRVGALNEIYTADEFADLMQQVEENYRALHGLPPVGTGLEKGGNASTHAPAPVPIPAASAATGKGKGEAPGKVVGGGEIKKATSRLRRS